MVSKIHRLVEQSKHVLYANEIAYLFNPFAFQFIEQNAGAGMCWDTMQVRHSVQTHVRVQGFYHDIKQHMFWMRCV